ncbi:hypothetical protein [Methylomonas lenta]|nr:hypothetical protein [Methylomonas lenta]
MTNRFRFVGMGSICASDESQPFILKDFGESSSQSNPNQPMPDERHRHKYSAKPALYLWFMFGKGDSGFMPLKCQTSAMPVNLILFKACIQILLFNHLRI